MSDNLGADEVPIAALQLPLCDADSPFLDLWGCALRRAPIYPALPVPSWVELHIFHIQSFQFMHAYKTVHPVSGKQWIGNYIFVIDHQAIGAGFCERSPCSQATVHVINGSHGVADKSVSAALSTSLATTHFEHRTDHIPRVADNQNFLGFGSV